MSKVTTLGDVKAVLDIIILDPFSPILTGLNRDLREKIATRKRKDLPAQVGHIASALGYDTPSEVPVTLLDETADAAVVAHLRSVGRSASLTRGCLSLLKLIRGILIDQGLLAPERAKFTKPERNRLTATNAEGKRYKLRPPLRKQRDPYAAKLDALPAALRRELDDMKAFYTRKVVKGRKRKAHRGSTWELNLERMLRFYGALAETGDLPLDRATLRDFVDQSNLESYVAHFDLYHGAVTQTVADVVAWALNVAENFFEDDQAASEISSMLKQMEVERVKDIDKKVQSVSADDLYALADKLYEHAYAYEQAHFNQKPGKAISHPRAMVAYHFGRALAVHLALAVWLRRSNLFGIEYGKHLYYRDGALWVYFSAEEMKSRQVYTVQVADLWRGEPAQRRLDELLKKYLELRPYLVERFLAANPGAEAPKTLFLSKYGTPLCQTGQWYFFSSLSRQYLGAEKEIHPHNVRHIMATYLIHRHGDAVRRHVKAILGHRSSETTDRFYARCERLFCAADGQRLIDNERQRVVMGDTVARISIMIEGLLERIAPERQATLTAEVLNDVTSGIVNEVITSLEPRLPA